MKFLGLKALPSKARKTLTKLISSKNRTPVVTPSSPASSWSSLFQKSPRAENYSTMEDEDLWMIGDFTDKALESDIERKPPSSRESFCSAEEDSILLPPSPCPYNRMRCVEYTRKYPFISHATPVSNSFNTVMPNLETGCSRAGCNHFELDC